MTDEKPPTWEDLVEKHRVDTAMSDEHAAAVWARIVRARPAAEQLVLVRPVAPSTQSGRRLAWMRLPAFAGGLVLVVVVVVAVFAARGAEDRAERSEVRAEQSEVVAERTVALLEAQAELQRPSHAVEAMMYATRPASVPAVAGIGRPPLGRAAAHAAWTRCSDAYVRGALEEAEVLCEEAMASDATYPPIYNTLGRIRADRGERDAAEKLYEQALVHDPNYVPALLGLSTCKALRRDLDGAEEAVLRALELAPENERAEKLAARIRDLESRARR